MSEPVKFGNGVPAPRPDWCPGAQIRGPRDMLAGLERNGVAFGTVYKTNSGLSESRVRCGKPCHVQILEDRSEDPREPVRRREVRLGLCDSCTQLEAYVRRARAELAGKQR